MRHLLLAAAVLASFAATGHAQNQQNPLPKIIAALESDKKTVRLQAATALGNHGTGASPPSGSA